LNKKIIKKINSKSLKENFSAQGTIEYLVILAVIVVISLIVVALVINVSSSPTQQITTSSEKTSNVAVGGISIVEAVSDLEGDSLLVLGNNSGEGILLKKISVGESENEYNNYIASIDSVPISLTGLASSCPCESGQKSVKCEFKFEYETPSGLRKTEYRTISVECVVDSVSVSENFIESIDVNPPIVELVSPLDNNVFVGNDLYFAFDLTEDRSLVSCTLFVGEDSNTYYNLGNGLNTIIYNKTGNDGGFDWNISCTDGTNTTSSPTRKIFMDANSQQIASCFELQNAINDNLLGDYELVSDVNCLETLTWDEGGGFNPIGDVDNKFKGTFNGNNYSINNLFINRDRDYVGLFTYTESALIKNLNLVDVNINASDYGYVGGVAGYISVSTLIDNVNVSGNFSASNRLGGFTGYAKDSIIQNSNNFANVNAVVAGIHSYTGGFVGINSKSMILNSSNFGDIIGSATVGGIVGYSWTGDQTLFYLNGLYNSGNIRTTLENVGGIAGGLSHSTVSNSYNVGSIRGLERVGGISGYNNTGSPIYNSYNTGDINGTSFYSGLGGITGEMKANIHNSFSVGRVFKGTSGSGGGIIGNSISGSRNNLHWLDNLLDDAIYCGGGNDTNCTKANSETDFYSNSYGVYTGEMAWDGNWIWSGENYPTLSWQE